MPQGLSSHNFQAALFDVDGTLVNSLEVFVRGLGDTYDFYLGFRPTREELLSLCGIPLRKQLAMFQESPPSDEKLAEMVDYAISRYQVHQDREYVFEEAVEALRILHRTGIRTALVTSKNAVELNHFLKRFDAADSVDITVCASDVLHPKPHPESAILACCRLGVEPHQAVMIGDSVFDLHCARESGVTPIAVGYGASDRQTLLAELPELYFDTPTDLLEWVKKSLVEPACQERNQPI